MQETPGQTLYDDLALHSLSKRRWRRNPFFFIKHLMDFCQNTSICT